MIIKMNNRRFLPALGTLLCCTAVTALQAASSNIPASSTLAALSSPQAGARANSGIESWYRSRKLSIAQPNSNLEALQSRADAGDGDALYQLGLIYQGGRGVTKNIPLAQQLLEKSAVTGNADAQYSLALLYRFMGDQVAIQRSIGLQERAAKQGHVEAQYGLGMLYANGQSVAQDIGKARHWLQQSAGQGNIMAQLSLNDLPRQTAQPTQRPTAQRQAQAARPAVRPPQPQPVQRQVAQSRPQAVQRQQVAQSKQAVKPAAARPVARPQTAKAQPSLAAASAETRSVDQNESMVNLAGMKPAQIRQAAEKGDMYAQLMLGALYEDGSDGVTQDPAAALRWYMKSAQQGYPKAQHNLALLYEDGRGTEQSYDQAVAWYKKAAEAGFTEAQNNLAVLYIMGHGVPEDRVYAEKLLRHAVSLGNPNAKRNLKMLVEGTG